MSGCTHFAVAHLQLLSWKVEPVFDDDDVSVDTREEIRMPQVASKETNEMSWCLNLLSSSAHVCVPLCVASSKGAPLRPDCRNW